ncbi:AAA family ATPase [Mycolicibacterium llatzerense]|uniref:AAA family ATPase n=1 Tax=Mycolicibacterium llatzerense TaxID=280871 RepID=UPI0021B537FB|nr:AAA family ATPase [Mycolicibacterium llatzerense]MCT7369618.1 hypothetical protein [Mycolicibacterium llatzerense]
MSIETKLLSRMMDPAEMATVVATGMSANVFEDLSNRTCFEWVTEYYHEHGTPPTADVMELEFPTLKFDAKVDEPVDWLIEKLQERLLINRAQNAMTDAARTLDADPGGTVAALQDAMGAIRDQAGRTAADGTPRLWAADDLRPATQPRWLAKNRLPRGAVSLLVGDEGIGKSLFWVYLAAAVTTGKPLFEFGVPRRDPAQVFVVVTEDDWATTVRPRLEVAGADLGMVRVICADEDGSGAPEFPRDLPLIANADPAPALVVVDAWLDTVPSKLQVKDPQHARQALHPWKDAATATDAAVLLLAHTNRVDSANTRLKYGATGELRKKARMALFAQRDDDGNLVIGPDKANTAASVVASKFTVRGVAHFSATEDHDGTVPLLEYVGETDQTAPQLVAQAHAAGHGFRVRDEVVEWLIGELVNGARWQTDLVEAASAAGYSIHQLKRYKLRAGVESEKDGQSAAWFWRLRGQDSTPADTQGSGGVSV